MKHGIFTTYGISAMLDGLSSQMVVWRIRCWVLDGDTAALAVTMCMLSLISSAELSFPT